MKKIFLIITLLYCFISKAQKQEPSGVINSGASKTLNFNTLKQITDTQTRRFKESPAERESEEERDKLIQIPVTDFMPVTKTNSMDVPLPNAKNGRVNSVCPDFEATNDNTGNPPDPNGTAGFDHIMTTVNSTVRIHKKDGTIISTVDIDDFWAGTGHTDIFDPKITYDPYNQRWIFVCCATRESANSALLIGVSQTFDPTGAWNIYSIDADPADVNWFDYPSIGFNKNWIIVSGNLFNIPGQTAGNRSRVWVVNKAAAYAGNGLSIPYFDNTNYFTICPSITYDPNENAAWCVANHNSNSGGNGFVKLFNIGGTAAAPTFSLGSTIQVGTAWAGAGVGGPQQGTSITLDLGDHRIQNVVYRNGRLYFVQNIFLPATSPTAAGVQMVAINPFSSAHLETFRINGTTTAMAAYPSITVNSENDVAIGFCTFYNNFYASAAAAYRRGLTGGFSSFVYRNGEDWYNYTFGGANRWGDYTATTTDPDDGRAMWVVSQYARPKISGTSQWGTWWKKICPDVCTNSFNLSGSSPNYKYEANSTIISTGIVNSGTLTKYDAGTRVTLSPGFRAYQGSTFKAYIDGCGGNK